MSDTVEHLGSANQAAWDAFVAAHPSGAFAQLSGHLRVLADTTHYRPEGRLLRRGGEVRGVLAWVEARWLRQAVSLPFYEYGGPLLAPDADAGEVAALLAAAPPLELRLAHGWTAPPAAVQRQALYPFAILSLEADPERILAACDRQVRKAVRKAEREGVTIVHTQSPETIERWFYPAYLRWMRDRHGTPPLSGDYWLACAEHLAGQMHLFSAWHHGRLIAQLLGFATGRRVVITTIVSDEDDWGLRPNDLVHWAFVRWACLNGCRWFDFGGARYEGQRRYKEKWGCTFGTYEQGVWPAGPALPPPAPESAPAELARRGWRHLPLAWTRRLGPPLRELLTL